MRCFLRGLVASLLVVIASVRCMCNDVMHQVSGAACCRAGRCGTGQWVQGAVVQDNGCRANGTLQWVESKWYRTMGAERMVQDNGCRANGTGQWVQSEWYRTMRAERMVQDNGCRVNGKEQLVQACIARFDKWYRLHRPVVIAAIN